MFRKLDRRLGLSALVKAVRKTRPEDYRPLWGSPPFSPGILALMLVGLLILSGLLLTLFYNPTAEQASESIARLHREAPLGWLVHNTHRWSAFFLLGFVILHALRVWVRRAYRYPRDLNWWVGLSLLLLAIALGGTGYLLRWDIKAFTLMDLVISNLSGVRLLGPYLVAFILGGSEPDVVPLYRGYALHIWFLPLTLLLILTLHLLIVWRQGLTEVPHAWRRLRGRLPFARWYKLLPGLGLLVAILALSWVTPYQGEAGPGNRSSWPSPDWLLIFYILPFWFFQGPYRILGALILPAALLVFLFLSPSLLEWLWPRRLAAILALFGMAGVIWLFSQVAVVGSQVPLQGCQACHRPGILGGAPTHLSEFEIRDPDWVVLHLKDPLDSLLEPIAPPERP